MCSSNMTIQISHFVGLSGVGGVQRNFVEYINSQAASEGVLKHKVYTLGKVDSQYKVLFKIYDISELKNLISLILDICSKKKIVHFYNNLTSLKVLIFLFFFPVRKLILHERGAIWNFPSSRSILLRFVVWKSFLILANSNATKIMLEKKFGIASKKIRVLHNGINTEIKYTKIKQERKIQPFLVGFIGRLDTPKGVHVLIDAMHMLDNNNIELIIAGNGALENILKKQAGGVENISFVGRVIDPYSFLCKLDLLVVPSIREPLGNVCLEAGLCKIAVLASNVDGIPEIINNKISGELITPTQELTFKNVNNSVPLPEYVVNPTMKKLSHPKQIDPKILANKIFELSKSPDLLQKYGERLYNNVICNFSMECYANKLHKIYYEVFDSV